MSRSIQNVEEARQAKVIFKDAQALIEDFNEFNPFHILPEERAQKYLNENWEGRMLDLKHFGFTPPQRAPRNERPAPKTPTVEGR
jgi:hypothetical protein